jgi:hypothetical protein
MPKVVPAPDFGPQEPIIPVTISPPSPPFGGAWSDNKITYSGERLLEFRHQKNALLTEYQAAQEAYNVRAQAFDEAWEAARVANGPPSAEETAAHQQGMQAFHQEQLDLDRAALLAQARYLVWEIRNGKGILTVGGFDQVGWDTLPTAALLWLVARGMAVARNELDGPFRS